MTSDKKKAKPRKRPCSTCPYRKDVPSGVWSEEEYDILPGYDEDPQSLNSFHCHKSPECLCSGWVGHKEHPLDLIAIRIGLYSGTIDEETINYTCEDVELFKSGKEAAEHGKKDIDNPGYKAKSAMEKIIKARALSNHPLKLDGENDD